MSSTQDDGGRVRPGRDRCEVCDVVILRRPVSNRRRCPDHVNQLVLVPLSAIRTHRSKTSRRDG
jgi:hypothetical protein